MRPLPLLCLLLFGCRSGGDAAPSPPTSAVPVAITTPTPTSGPPDPAAWTTVKLDELLGTYKDNEVRGDTAYKGKVIRVAGLVGEVKKDAVTEQIYVTVGKGGLLEIPVAQCFAASGEEAAAGALHKGDPVAVEGRVDGLLMNVLIRDCKLNPVLKTCERLATALGGGKCEAGKDAADAATLEIRSEKEASLGVVMCLPTKERFQKGLAVFKDRSVVASEKALCLGAFEVLPKGGTAGPLPEGEQKAKLKAFFDAL